MKTLAVVTSEKRLFKQFEVCGINDGLQLLICRCARKRRLKRKMNKFQVCGYISEKDIKLPFTRYDGSGIFCAKVHMLIKELIKAENIGADSVAVVIDGGEGADTLFDGIAGIFREFYIISPDYHFAAEQGARLMNEYGIAAHTDEPQDICDVEIITGSESYGLGRRAFNYRTEYEIKHGYNLPVRVDSRAFTEALILNGLMTESELERLSVVIGG